MTQYLFLATVVVLAASACERTDPSASRSTISAPAPTDSARSEGALEIVTDRSLVCMVNDQFMGRPQIPVVVNGNTYYGCCPACKDRLGNDARVRAALDPVSSQSVDKAVAVIGKTSSGATLYFENEQNLVAYSRRVETK